MLIAGFGMRNITRTVKNEKNIPKSAIRGPDLAYRLNSVFHALRARAGRVPNFDMIVKVIERKTS